MEDVDIKLPNLKGDSIEEHFYSIAKEQVEPYQKLISSIVNAQLSKMPKVFFFNLKSFPGSFWFWISDLVFHTWMDLL